VKQLKNIFKLKNLYVIPHNHLEVFFLWGPELTIQ